MHPNGCFFSLCLPWTSGQVGTACTLTGAISSYVLYMEFSMFYVGCRYIDQDGQENEDPTAGEFSTKQEALNFLAKLQEADDITHAWVDENPS